MRTRLFFPKAQRTPAFHPLLPQRYNLSLKHSSFPRYRTRVQNLQPLASLTFSHFYCTGAENQPLFQRILGTIKKEANHYWKGTIALKDDYKITKNIKRKKEITRTESRFCERVNRDLKALIPFATIAMLPIVGYSVPILVAYFPSFMPSTYWKPETRVLIRENALADREEFSRFFYVKLLNKKDPHIQNVISKIQNNKDFSLSEFTYTSPNLTHQFVFQIPSFLLKLLSKIYGAKTFSLRKLKEKVSQGTFKRFNYLDNDDQLIQQEGIENLGVDAVRDALQERGFWWVGMTPTEQVKLLSAWIELRQRGLSVEAMICFVVLKNVLQMNKQGLPVYG